MTTEEKARRAEQGRRVRMARNAIPMSQTQLAQKVSEMTGEEISRTIIGRIEKGTKDAGVGIIKSIAKLTGLSETWLFGDRSNPGYFNPWDTPAITQLELALTA